MSNLTLTSLLSRLPAAGNIIGDYYPSPQGLGIENQTLYNSYYGAIYAMLLDEEVVSDVEMRRSSALMVPYYFEGSDEDVAWAESLLESLSLDLLLEQGLYGVAMGWQPVELHWDVIDNTLTPVGSERRKAETFVFGNDGNLVHNPWGFGATTIPKAKVIPFVRNGSRERPYGESILEELWPIWQSKWISWASIERLGKKYAVPTVVALSKATNEDDLNNIAAALAPLENGDAIALSGVEEIEVLSASGKVSELLQTIEYIDNKINKRITGQTLTNSSQQYGSRALGEVHERAALRVALSDIQMVADTLNRTLLRWIFALNKRPGKVKLMVDKDKFRAMYETSSDSSGDGSVTLCV